MSQHLSGRHQRSERHRPYAELRYRELISLFLLTFDHPMPGGGGKTFRVCTFTGSWAIGSTKNVAFKYQTSTPNTAVATNLFFPVTGSAALDCAIAKDGTAWFLIDVPFYTASASYVSGVSVGATLNTTTCAITVATTASTATATFLRIGVP